MTTLSSNLGMSSSLISNAVMVDAGFSDSSNEIELCASLLQRLRQERQQKYNYTTAGVLQSDVPPRLKIKLDARGPA